MSRGLKVSIRLFGNDPSLKAFADVAIRVRFGEITIRRFKVLQSDGKPWVAFPQVQYNHLLENRYANLLIMNKRIEDYLKNQILNAYRKQLKYQPTRDLKSFDLAELTTLFQEGVR